MNASEAEGRNLVRAVLPRLHRPSPYEIDFFCEGQ
jgi:hypothetical protein